MLRSYFTVYILSHVHVETARSGSHFRGMCRGRCNKMNIRTCMYMRMCVCSMLRLVSCAYFGIFKFRMTISYPRMTRIHLELKLNWLFRLSKQRTHFYCCHFSFIRGRIHFVLLSVNCILNFYVTVDTIILLYIIRMYVYMYLPSLYVAIYFNTSAVHQMIWNPLHLFLIQFSNSWFIVL